MKEKVRKLMAFAKRIRPNYFIQYTTMNGEIVILDANKTFPADGKPHKNLIWGDAMAKLWPDEEVIAKYEKDGISHEKAKEFYERLFSKE